MIVVTQTETTITLEGHANYAPQGYDIVCAGISTLIQTLIQSIEELASDTIQYSMQSGKVSIEFGNLSEQAQVLVDSFFVGVRLMADEYPNHVTLSKH